MALELGLEQLLTFGGILVAGVGAYWKLKNSIDAQVREYEIQHKSVVDDIAETDKEVQKVWEKMLTINGHTKECQIMSLKIDKAIRESADEINKKLDETMVDFQKHMSGMVEQISKKIVENNGANKDIRE